MKLLKKYGAAILAAALAALLFSCNTDTDNKNPSDETRCNAVKTLTIGAASDKVTLAWVNPDAPFYGVRISMSPAEGDLAEPNVYEPETTSATIGGLRVQTEYTFTLTSVDSDGKDTSKSVSITTTTSAPSAENPSGEDKTPPADATDLNVKAAVSSITVTWKDAADSDIFGYIVTYKEKSGAQGRSVLTPLENGSIFVIPGKQKCKITDFTEATTYTVTVRTMDTSGNLSGGSSKDVTTLSEDIEPIPYGSRTKNLDFIFGTDSVAEITLTIARSEWDDMLDYYDRNPRNEECIHADFTMTKGGYTWEIGDVGIRPRGNTSRIRPQNPDGTYNQSHFKIDFEEWLSDDDPERKLAGCMKGLILKRFKDDPTYTREVFGYNFFRDNGIWTSPRAGYAHLAITITEEDGETTNIDYGVYAMIEEIKKQFLKERSDSAGGKLKNNKGNLWKCCWQASGEGPSMTTNYDPYFMFGVEDISLDESKSLRYDYDLKTNKDDVGVARNEFISFIKELNAPRMEDETKAWFESKMDIELFLKTYACNVLLGMDDDYWRNQNNYYFYFDTSKKAYFIPYDYDNILGTNIYTDTATRNPLDWGEGNDAPLIDRMLSVPEFMEKYMDYLLELSDEQTGFVTESQEKIKRWQEMIKEYLNNSRTYDTSAIAAYTAIGDDVAEWCSNYGRYKLLSGGEDTNYFMAKAKSVQTYCNPTYTTLTFRFNGPDGAENATLLTQDGIYTGSPYTLEGAIAGVPISQYIHSIELSGYDFIGWFDAEDGGNQVTAVPNTNTSIYARWRKLQSYTIAFNANGGTLDGSETRSERVIENQNLYDLFQPKKEKAFFIGWFDAADGGNQITFPSSDTTVYAHYVPSIYTYWTSEKDGKATEHLTLTFNPYDFYVDTSSITTVVATCELNGWNPEGSLGSMNIQTDGTYTYTYSSDSREISSMWPGYKFAVDGEWIGYDRYKYQLPPAYAEYVSPCNFLIPELGQ